MSAERLRAMLSEATPAEDWINGQPTRYSGSEVHRMVWDAKIASLAPDAIALLADFGELLQAFYDDLPIETSAGKELLARLDALTTKIEELEHDAIDVEADRRYQQDRARAAEQRVEELERKRDEARNTAASWAKKYEDEIGSAEKAERALAAIAAKSGSYSDGGSGVYQDCESEMREIARAALRSEDTSDES